MDSLTDADSEVEADCDSEIDSLTDADSEVEADCDSETDALTEADSEFVTIVIQTLMHSLKLDSELDTDVILS